MLLSGEPSMNGRELAGHSATIATHQPQLTTIASAAGEQLREAPAQPGGRGHEVDQPERRQHEERLHHLRQEREADHRPGRDHPAGARALERPGQAVGARHEQAHEQRVGVVEAEHQRGDRRDRQQRPRQQAGARPEPALDRGVQQRDRRDALERLRDRACSSC